MLITQIMLDKKANIINTPHLIAFLPSGLSDKPVICGVNILVIMEDNGAIKCNKCGSINFRKQGNWKGRKIFYCKDCKKYFYEPSTLTKFTRGEIVDKECPYCGWMGCTPTTTGSKCPKCKKKFNDKTKELILCTNIKEGTKKCRSCKEIKHTSEFYQNKRAKSGYTTECILCMNIRRLKKTYNITINDVDNLFKQQNDCCDICGKHIKGIFKRSYYIDHDHKTGKIRGLLCRECNLLLGFALDDIKILTMAITYLEKNN